MHPFIAEQLVASHQTDLHEAARHHRFVMAARAATARTPRTRLRWPLRVSGVLLLGITLIAFTDASAVFGSSLSRPAVRPEWVTLVGFTPEAEERIRFEPGASRFWPAGEHIVGVAVVAGSLTVYGPAGERTVYTAGDGYAAGWTGYRAENETADPVEISVTRHARP
jgi:hypothetical protein